ncbi:AraC-like DNA-binding protein [Mucilaginibacter yixingensis]|uniref:AraC-like DNA-binding protein n=1 Tax=Mucilaginibacter yixingensis TaxID=1295612 RepID=A0A2T5JE29_9SPHI|nr:AraC family transcriptional regulator [Mucilaginibacter yixingensis]PTR00020.1 AraC-like DNA-binding protein [Mucilaginibacter yixingensis]
MTTDAPNDRPRILYSCYHSRSREGEQFVPEHIFSYQVAGTMMVNDGEQEFANQPGDFRFMRRNRLLKFSKVPPENGGDFKSISIRFSQDMLRNFSLTHAYKVDGPAFDGTILKLESNPHFKAFINSLLPYLETEAPDPELMEHKVTEALMLLLKTNPELKNTLFDFSEPGKIDLEAFMNRNFHFNVGLNRFAYLTGRSLATFKRDFEKAFHTSPSKWLQQRRLREAHYLIKEKGAAPSTIYMDLGFEDLSHFSFAFKKMYGVAPSRV